MSNWKSFLVPDELLASIESNVCELVDRELPCPSLDSLYLDWARRTLEVCGYEIKVRDIAREGCNEKPSSSKLAGSQIFTNLFD